MQKRGSPLSPLIQVLSGLINYRPSVRVPCTQLGLLWPQSRHFVLLNWVDLIFSRPLYLTLALQRKYSLCFNRSRLPGMEQKYISPNGALLVGNQGNCASEY